MRYAEIAHSYLGDDEGVALLATSPTSRSSRARGGLEVLHRLPDVEEARVVPAARRGADARDARPHRGGRRFPGIETNTAYSFGLDDQEFVVAFDADDPAEFLDLVQELRATESSAYTESETPIFTCICGCRSSGRWTRSTARPSGAPAAERAASRPRLEQLLERAQLHARASVGSPAVALRRGRSPPSRRRSRASGCALGEQLLERVAARVGGRAAARRRDPRASRRRSPARRACWCR